MNVPTPQRSWTRPAWRLTIAGAAAAAALAGAVALARSRRAGPEEPADAAGPCLPDGRSIHVTTEDGARLVVTVAGPDDGPTVVLAHCWTGVSGFWAVIASSLVAEGHRVVLYDHRGHGQSTAGQHAPAIDVLGDDLRAVLEAVDARHAVLVGHSMGGMTIQAYAVAHPTELAERVEGVVLVATAARFLGRALPTALVEWLLGEGRSEWTRRGLVGRQVVRRALGRKADPHHVALTLEAFASATGASRAGYLSAMASMDLRQAGPVLASLPTTVLVGTRDVLTPVPLARRLAAGIPGARLRVIRGAGHMLPLEAPEEILEAIRSNTVRRPAQAAAPDEKDGLSLTAR